jgi:CMP-N-acetylneuraminic acid synthetase
VLEHHVVGKRWEHLSCIALHGAAIMVPVAQLRSAPPRLLGPGCALVETDELEAIDIDTPFDLEVAQMLAERHGL